MFFPRQIAEAKPNDVSRKAVEEFAAKVRAQLLLPETGGCIRKLAKNLGGTVRMVGLMGRPKGQDDFLMATGKNAFTVAVVEHGAIIDVDGFECADIAKAVGHMLMHYPMHAKRHGDKVAMVVVRYPDEDDRAGTAVTREGHWFAWELLAPVRDVAAAYNKLASGLSEQLKARQVGYDLKVAARIADIQIKRARELGYVGALQEEPVAA